MTAKDESALRVVEIENQMSVQRYLEDSLFDVSPAVGVICCLASTIELQICSGLGVRAFTSSFG